MWVLTHCLWALLRRPLECTVSHRSSTLRRHAIRAAPLPLDESTGRFTSPLSSLPHTHRRRTPVGRIMYRNRQKHIERRISEARVMSTV